MHIPTLDKMIEEASVELVDAVKKNDTSAISFHFGQMEALRKVRLMEREAQERAKKYAADAMPRKSSGSGYRLDSPEIHNRANIQAMIVEVR